MGAFIELFNNCNLNLLVETFYIQKGRILETSASDPDGNIIGKIEYNTRVDYLCFPILGKFVFGSKLAAPYIFAGPRIDFFLGYDSKNDFDQFNDGRFNFDNVYDEFEKIDFGGTIGLGYEFSLISSQTFFIEMRYSPSFTNSYKTDLLKVTNNSFEFLTGVKF